MTAEETIGSEHGMGMQEIKALPLLNWLVGPKATDAKDVPQNAIEEQSVSQNSADAKPLFKNYGKEAIVFALVFYIIIIVKDSWLGDDAFITVRTVYNFIYGYGLTWNTDERVQTYTHPLWMFLLSIVSFFIRSPYVAALLLGVSVSVLAIVLLAFRLAKSPLLAIVSVVCLTASKAFVDYSTSGLENPMTHLLIVIFALVFFQYQHHKRYVLWLSLLAMLMILNRMDTILIFLPALLYVLWERRSWNTLRTMVLAFVPFVLWELFSLFYYGSLFPNTAYAKLNLGVSTFSLIKQGVGYLISSFSFDPILCVIIALALGMVIVLKDWKSLPLVCGMLLYMGYVVKVGGDFMAGRFLTPPFLLAIIILMRNIQPDVNLNLMLLLGVALFFGIATPYTRWSNDPAVIYGSGTSWRADPKFIDSRGITDERYFYASAVSLFRLQRRVSFPDYDLAKQGWEARISGKRVVIITSIGIFGYMAGPHEHVVDPFALGDPLLARLPVNLSWDIGQFRRDIPGGYVQTIQTGQNVISDPSLAQYYDKLHFVISGPLFSWSRLVEVVKLNVGSYNYLLQQYNHWHNANSPAPPSPTHIDYSCPIWTEKKALIK